MQFNLLGPVEVVGDGGVRQLPATKARAVLAVLASRSGSAITVDQLVDALWTVPPRSAPQNVRQYVHQLRRVVGPQRILHRSSGYLLVVHPGERDCDRFATLAEQGRSALAAGDPAAGSGLLRQALALWRGPAFAGLDDVEPLRRESVRWQERRRAAVRARIDADLALGRHGEVVAELSELVAEDPLHEGWRAQLMIALYRSGRQGEALQVYRDTREILAAELGLEPGKELRRLEQAVLTADPALDPPRLPAVVAGAPVPVSAAAGGPPAQLPSDVAGFTGRGELLHQLDDLAAAGRTGSGVSVVVVAGTAGVGKTALAVHWAHLQRERFPDGQLFVNLRGYAAGPPVRPLEVLARFLRALGMPGAQVPDDIDEAAAAYRSLLSGKRFLVVLDDARTSEQVRPLLPAEPGCMVLVTSRHRLGGLVARDGARRLAVRMLGPAETHALLTYLLGERRVRAEADAAAELARLCGHLPLAVRIAAANLADSPDRSIGYLVGELRDGDRLGTLGVIGDDQTAVRAAFDVSYLELDGSARRLFRLLSLVPGSDVTALTAARLAGVPDGGAARLLDALATAHLVEQRGPGRYGLHDLLRVYAGECVRREETETERTAATERLYVHYLRGADAAARRLYPQRLRIPMPAAEDVVSFPDDTTALEWLDNERVNLVAAVEHAAAHGPRPYSWLLADALRGYFWLRMYPSEWLTVAHAGLAAAEAEDSLLGQAAAQLSLGTAHYRWGRHRAALEPYTQALELSRRAGWHDGQAAALGNLGLLHEEAGRLRVAADRYAEALALAEEMGVPAGRRAILLGNLGALQHQMGHLEPAAEYHRQALALYRAADAPTGEADALTDLGHVCHALGRIDESLRYLGEALRLNRQTGDRESEPRTLCRIAEVHHDAGRHLLARDLAEQALTLARSTANHRYEADALTTLGAAHLGLGGLQAARDLHEDALRRARETQARGLELTAAIGLATTLRRLGDLRQARLLGEQAETSAREDGYALLQRSARRVLAGIEESLP
ncbi:AfsR/SARP family transcriptional regulator [Couchioplanes azureus]|uniref:AfsR/SARP family transcriptional regulator n=1 Tax=Couchioplanes caeruleus TaxID=56438 RepID=UPI001670FF58|nr:BTAD domain-containing putative transcriptional regulator [Couchioplanes caeruleus]GGQ83033.1 SARP family transcriptional regulator [Couchioplanes caeruleus subsp. azureus]